MKEKILQALKTKYANKGFSARTLESMADHLATTVTEETQIDNAVSGVEPVLSIFQSEIDNRVNAAVAKAKSDAQQPQNPPANPNQGGVNPPKPDTADMPAWAKAIIDANEAMQKSLASLQGDQIMKTRSQTLSEKLATAPDVFKNKILKDFSRMKFDNDDEFQTYLQETEEDIKQVVQSTADEGLGMFPKPNQSQGSTENVNTAVETWAKKKVAEKERN